VQELAYVDYEEVGRGIDDASVDERVVVVDADSFAACFK
jgi:hypothetical protein